MNPMDILGSLLGAQVSRGGRGGGALEDIFGRKTSQPAPAPTNPSSRGPSRSSKPMTIDEKARELEELLNVARSGSGSRTSAPAPRDTPITPPRNTSQAPSPTPRREPEFDDKAVILVRAMINAAKADGRMDAKEQQKIIGQLRDPSPQALQFLQQEFNRSSTAREFAASVPIGMEQQVYTLSLIAIDLDSGQEAKYLMELAESLRLPADVREQIHQRLGAPSIY